MHLADGPRAGNDLVQVVPREPGTPVFAVDDPVVVSWSGGDPDDPASYQLVDFQRGGSLGWLGALFAAAVLVLGRWRGLASLVALGIGFVVLLAFVLPAILSGRSPLAVAVVGAGVIMFAVLYLTHGLSARTSTAVLGTLVSLALIGVLGAAFSAAARLTGLDDQTNALITSLGTGVDARGLLLAGMVIGALGVLDDVTVTQTSAVWELHAANPRLGAPGAVPGGDADRARPRRLRRQHPRARLRRGGAAAAAACSGSRAGASSTSRPARTSRWRSSGRSWAASGSWRRCRSRPRSRRWSQAGRNRRWSLHRTARGPSEGVASPPVSRSSSTFEASERCSQLSRRCPEGPRAPRRPARAR